ncbi:MAG: DNA methyltransferase, partial [Thaumarchaeota archaeon]|nr:DNA methyltransferase [Nitrososphaerota archaeon]
IYQDYDPEYIKQAYSNKDENGSYTTSPLQARSLSGGGYKYKWHEITDVWKFPKKRLDQLEANNLIHWPKSGSIPRRKIYLKDAKGLAPTDMFLDIKSLSSSHKERTGYPTQKPLELYERIIKASSDKGDIVLDPFCGCATTCVAAEKLDRQWVGIDIWSKAHKVVKERIKKECYLADTDKEREDLIHTKGTITYAKRPPKRTDDGLEAVPKLKNTLKAFDLTKHDPLSNKEKKEKLIKQDGLFCQGCGFTAHDERYLELDHNIPRAAGGPNLIWNRILLCSPCNKLKRHYYTMYWLRDENRKKGFMKNEKRLKPLEIKNLT